MRWGLAFVLADLLTGSAAFAWIVLGAVGLAFVTGMRAGWTPLIVGGPIELLVALGMIGTGFLAWRGYGRIVQLARGPIAAPLAV